MYKTIKKVFLNIGLILLVGLLIGCSDNTDEPNSEPLENNSAQDSVEEDMTEQKEASVNEENDSDNTTTEESVDNTTEVDPLSPYSSQEIEYARIWLQLGPNQEIDELNVRHITMDEPINPNDETSISYPEDVIQLAGSRLVDGSITYSGNGDGTINVYTVPLRWDGQYPAEEAFYNDIVENTKLEAIDVGDDEKVIELIKKIKLH